MLKGWYRCQFKDVLEKQSAWNNIFICTICFSETYSLHSHLQTINGWFLDLRTKSVIAGPAVMYTFIIYVFIGQLDYLCHVSVNVCVHKRM